MLSPGKYCYGIPRSQDEFLRAINIEPGDLNSEGHRSLELEKLQKDYILVCGCSQSFGIGVSKHQTYSSVLMNLLNLPVYNISIPATGCDFISFNIFKWIINFPIKPKTVIVQWSHIDSRIYMKENNLLNALGPWINDKPFSKLFSRESRLFYKKNLDHINQRSKKKIHNLSSFIKNSKINLIEFKLEKNDINVDLYPAVDMATDKVHIGSLSHADIAHRLANRL